MAEMLGIENRICCCCKRFSSGCTDALHSTPPDQRGGILVTHAFDYGLVRWSLCWRGETGGVPKTSLFHINDFNHYDLMLYKEFLHTPLSGAPQKCFQLGPALAKASPATIYLIIIVTSHFLSNEVLKTLWDLIIETLCSTAHVC